MATLSDSELAQAVSVFPADQRVTAFAVALAESGGNPTARNKNANGSTDYGLFQINSVHSRLLRNGNPDDPNDNARMALSVWHSAGQSWSPWVAYKRGSHLRFLPRAKKAVGESSGSSVDANIFGLLTDKATWLRVAMFVAGIVLLSFALFKATGASNLIVEGAKLAATKGMA